jgi:ABC-type uncharacterized transport system substrate-binding protein
MDCMTSKPKYKPLAPEEAQELVALRLFRDSAIDAAIEAGERMARQDKRIEEPVEHMAKMRDVLYNALCNTAHLVPAYVAPDTKRPRTKPDPARMRRQAK